MFCTATDYRVIENPALVICSTYNSLLTALTAIYHALYSSAFKMRVEKNRIISKNASASMASASTPIAASLYSSTTVSQCMWLNAEAVLTPKCVGECMTEAAEHVAPLEIADIVDYESRIPLYMHRLFRSIAFRPDREVAFFPPPLHHDAFLRDGEVHEFNKNREYLSMHPLVARSFATSVPVQRMVLLAPVMLYGAASGDIMCPRGITVTHVLKATQAK